MQPLVIRDSQVRAGEPVVRGTRISVYVIEDLVQQGASMDEILEDYPSLTDRGLNAGLAYAQAHPRPETRPTPWVNGVVIHRS